LPPKFFKKKERKGKMKVFLGGTCNGSTWRNTLIKYLKIDYYNPVVDDRTLECQEEDSQKALCDLHLYVLTPKMKDIYSIAEMVESSLKQPKNTAFCFLATDGEDSFDVEQMRSINKVGELLARNGAEWASTLDDAAWILNRRAGKQHDIVIVDPKSHG
jgi:hypothetical protein